MYCVCILQYYTSVYSHNVLKKYCLSFMVENSGIISLRNVGIYETRYIT
jgi:hypothetical protein